MRILITGGSGYLGRHLTPLAQRQDEVVYTFFSEDLLNLPGGVRLDVRRKDAVMALLGDFRPNVIIHAAGSNRSADMETVITAGTRHVVEAAAAVSARLIFLSTDVVFDGTAGPYAESAEPTPIHAYGRAKQSAEAIAQTYSNHVIIRTSLIYGLDLMDNGTRWLVQSLRAGQPVTLFANQRRNPVWAVSLSNALLELAASTFTGVLNIAGAQAMTRAEFGLRMLDWWGVTERASLAVGSGDPQRWPADCRLDLSLAQAVLQTPLPGVDTVLANYHL
ncbi:MAG: sugar nucleotide-binding protein [Anaerolineae bacterium]|nr:sugar nucleotide-binding protein [Anaerolineae bacterium]